MKTSTALGAAAFSLALTGGAIAGAVLGTPSVSGAQDETTSTTVADDQDEATSSPGADDHGPAGHLHRSPRGEGLAVAAEALGMSEEDLRAELRDGRSIADVAEERGVDVQQVVDALVADATEHLEAAIEELPDRMAEVVDREGPFAGRRHRADARGWGGPGPAR